MVDRSRLAAVAATLILSLQMVTPAIGSQSSDSDRPSLAINFILVGSQIGDGWRTIDVPRRDFDETVFANVAAAAYGGPHGSRAYLWVWVTLNEPLAETTGWRSSGEVFDGLQSNGLIPYDGTEADMAGDPLPEGCVAARRALGTDLLIPLAASATLCRVAPDVIILAYVSGTITDDLSFEASEELIGLSLSYADVISLDGTPTP